MKLSVKTQICSSLINLQTAMLGHWMSDRLINKKDRCCYDIRTELLLTGSYICLYDTSKKHQQAMYSQQKINFPLAKLEMSREKLK